MSAATAEWSRRRLQVRSVLSATMPVAWIWVAATALIPYFLIGHQRGAGSLEMFGIARSTWLGFHAWSSIAIGLATIVHVLLNRRGVARSYRILGGASRTGSRTRPRSLAWVAAVALLLVTIGGSWAFASVGGRGTAISQADVEQVGDGGSRGRGQSGAGGADGPGEHRSSSGGSYRGGQR